MIVCPCILWVTVDLPLHCLRVRVAADMLHHFHLMVICLVNTHYKAIDIPGLSVIPALWLYGQFWSMTMAHAHTWISVSLKFRVTQHIYQALEALDEKNMHFFNNKKKHNAGNVLNSWLEVVTVHNPILTFKFSSISFSKKCKETYIVE